MGDNKKNILSEKVKNIDEDVSVSLRHHSSSPRKMRLIANIIRNKNINYALSILKFNKNKVSNVIHKTLCSALSNWQLKNQDKDIEDSKLYIRNIFVNHARTLKSIRPAPQGKWNRIRKKFNHLIINISSRNDNYGTKNKSNC